MTGLKCDNSVWPDSCHIGSALRPQFLFSQKFRHPMCYECEWNWLHEIYREHPWNTLHTLYAYYICLTSWLWFSLRTRGDIYLIYLQEKAISFQPSMIQYFLRHDDRRDIWEKSKMFLTNWILNHHQIFWICGRLIFKPLSHFDCCAYLRFFLPIFVV